MDRLVNLGQYMCQKVVEAGKVITVEHKADGTCRVHYRNRLGGHDTVDLTEAWCNEKHVAPGGYLVQYTDGYLSFSPQEPFESGYNRVDDPQWKPTA